jgi:ABC-type multidrug transport system ATPase subunit
LACVIVPETSEALLSNRRRDEGRKASPAVGLNVVTRVFGVLPALVRVDLRVERGETLLVRGPNGAGKTTLLRVIATALSPTYGTGSVLGFDLHIDREEIRRRVELLGHRTRLYEDLTGRENLRFACMLHGIDPNGIHRVLDRVGLGEAAEERVRGYSQGMRQRVAVARALLRSPELLLLDEPYAGLDASAKEVVDDAIREAGRVGRTVILATHDPTRGEMAGRTVSMEAGRLLSGGAA